MPTKETGANEWTTREAIKETKSNADFIRRLGLLDWELILSFLGFYFSKVTKDDFK